MADRRGMTVRSDHQIVAFRQNRMVLFDTTSGDRIIVAVRNAEGNWVIRAVNGSGIADRTVPGDIQPGPTYRTGAINAMIEHALAALPGSGFGCVVPHGLAEEP